jgi:1,4-alpha-glucan branching enzyme
MQELISENVESIRSTTLRLYAPEAQSVYISGSFNGWEIDESCRMVREDGAWVARLPLDAGVYRYQFVVDGRWQPDPSNDKREANGFGDMNSLLEVAAHGA